jgi:hypothetical protein
VITSFELWRMMCPFPGQKVENILEQLGSKSL